MLQVVVELRNTQSTILITRLLRVTNLNDKLKYVGHYLPASFSFDLTANISSPTAIYGMNVAPMCHLAKKVGALTSAAQTMR